MKIIVSKKELKAIQTGIDSIIQAINTIDPATMIDRKDILTSLANIKEQVYFKYKLFEGEFIITISEELTTDYVALTSKLIVKALPVFKALEPIMALMVPAFENMKKDVLEFTAKYSIGTSQDVNCTNCKKEDTCKDCDVIKTF